MNLKPLLISFSLSIFLSLSMSCKEGSKKESPSAKGEAELVSEESDAPDPNKQWQLVINAQLDSLYPLYVKDAYKLSAKGELIEGSFRIMDLYKQKKLVVNDIIATERINAVLDSTVIYELGNFITPDRSSYQHLIIWRKQGKETKRELEMAVIATPGAKVPAELEERRNAWMSLCNEHRVADLVNDLYSENTLYYNHKPMVVGREAVIKEYQYMSDSAYKLELKPLAIQAVNKELVYEIGQCSGSYPGNYVLVWKKEDDGIWRILLDSNI